MENNTSSDLKEFARRLLALESAAGKVAWAKNSAAFRVCEKLRHSLGKLMGIGGFRALQSRALALSSLEITWLHALRVKGDGSLEGLAELEAQHGREAVVDGEVALVAHLLGLLVTFIGPTLTLGLVQEIWPKVVFKDLNFGTGEQV